MKISLDTNEEEHATLLAIGIECEGYHYLLAPFDVALLLLQHRIPIIDRLLRAWAVGVVEGRGEIDESRVAAAQEPER